jgi:hypothetical protein
MAGLDPAIYAAAGAAMDGRLKLGHDGGSRPCEAGKSRSCGGLVQGILFESTKHTQAC